MISLDDTALVRIAIAACAVPVEERRRWLRDLVRRFDPPSRAAERQRRHRARQRNGKVVVAIPVDRHAAVCTLTGIGVVQPGEPLTDARIAELIEAQLSEWFCAWTPPK